MRSGKCCVPCVDTQVQSRAVMRMTALFCAVFIIVHTRVQNVSSAAPDRAGAA